MGPPFLSVDEIEEGLGQLFHGLSQPEAVARLLVAVLESDHAARRLQERPDWRKQLEMRVKDLTSPRNYSPEELAALRAEWAGAGPRAKRIESVVLPRQRIRGKDRPVRDVWFVRYLCFARLEEGLTASQPTRGRPGRPAGSLTQAIAKWAAQTDRWARGEEPGGSRLVRAAHLEWRAWSGKSERLKRAYVHRRLTYWLGPEIEDRPRVQLAETDEATGEVLSKKVDRDELYRKMWLLVESKGLTFADYRREGVAQATSTAVDVNISQGQVVDVKVAHMLGARVSRLRPGGTS